MNNQFTVLIIIVVFLIACNDEPGPEGNHEPLNFISLTADQDTIEAGTNTGIVAEAEGYELSYHWSATSGSILGSGSEVTYAPGPCSVGENTITCKVTDGYGKSDTKSVTIVVI